jgi:hypothetical protein
MIPLRRRRRTLLTCSLDPENQVDRVIGHREFSDVSSSECETFNSLRPAVSLRIGNDAGHARERSEFGRGIYNDFSLSRDL